MRNAMFLLLTLGSLLLSGCNYIAAGNAKILYAATPAQALSPTSLSVIADLLPTDKRTSFHVSTLALSLSMLANIQQDIGASLTDIQKSLVIQQTKDFIVSQVSALNISSALALSGEDTTPTETLTQSTYATTFVITGVMESIGGDASLVSDISTRQTVIGIGVGSLMNSVGKISDTDAEKTALSASIAKNALNGLISIAKIPEEQAIEAIGVISDAIITHTEKAGLSASLDLVVNQMTTSMVASLETAGFSVANVSSAINQLATSTMQAFSKISLDPLVLQQKNMLQGMMNAAAIGLNSLSAVASDKGTYLSTMVGSTIAHLPDAGVSDATDKTTLIGNVITSAVQNMASAGFSTSDTLQIALKQISQQATLALAQAGFISSSDVSTLSNHSIASGISSLSSIQIEKSNTDITSFAGKMMEGALFSLGAMQTAGILSIAELSTSVQSMINKGLDRMSTSYAGTQTELPNIAVSFVNASLSGLAAGGISAQNIASMQGQLNTSVNTNLQTHGVSASDADVSYQVNSAFSQAQNLASLLSSKNFTACESAFSSSFSDAQFLSTMSTMASTSNKILCQMSTTDCPEKRNLSTAQYTWQKSSLSTSAIPLCELIYAYHGSATTYAANSPFIPSDSTSNSTFTESNIHTSTNTDNDTTIEISGFIHQLFVTSTTYNQNLTYHGLSGSAAGDAICESLAATNPSLSKSLVWKMLVPSAFDSVETQLTLLGPVVNLRNPVPSDSEFLSTTTSAFFSGTLHAAPKYTEKGNILASGSTAFGFHAPSTDFASLAGVSASCGDFQSVYNRASYYVANPFSTTSDWAGSTTTSACSFDNARPGLHYYCLSLPGPVIPTAFSATGPNSAGHVSGGFTTPSGTNLISKIVISRNLGVQPYACGTGSFVKQYLPAELPANRTLSFTDSPVKGLYRYSMCVYDTMSQVVYTAFSDPVLLLDPATPKTYAFFTEDTFDGKMSSPYGDVTSATADTRCQVAASRAKLENSAIDWKALISYSSGSTAASILSGISSIYSVQEEFLSDGGYSWLTSRGSEIIYTEWGRELVDDWIIWTGSTSSGDNAATPTCNGWIINLTGSHYGTSGTVHQFSGGWFSTGSPLCNTTAHVLCLSHVR